ncbi:MAG: tRNA pseudouridine(38-40) synthase TruA, partial [Clostridia bacterium]|nr:tRNA pseudouridine(38-40) synthase TruA [Clostridia bacterium]
DMKKIKLNISYIGTAYCGWQVQPNAVSVQQRVQDAVEKTFGKRYPLTGCSRTDSGVHARSFVCTVELDENANNIPCERIPLVMNRHLPTDIAVRQAEEAEDDFHPRYSCLGKAYEYIFYDNPVRDPFLEGRVAHILPRLDADKMNEAATQIVGNQDFRSFMASGSKIEDTVRTVYDCRVSREGDMVKLYISADGFLYNMVRIIAGTLAEVGHGKRTKAEVKAAIDSKDRKNSGQTAPPEGLYLYEVFYRKEKENEEG